MNRETCDPDDLTPEHVKRGSIDHDSNGPLHPELDAAYDYVHRVMWTADDSTSAMWHGWALREAFLAGISFTQQERGKCF